MKIQKIIVDEIPEKCYFCDLCVDLADGDGYRCIGITNADAQDNRLGYHPAELPFRRHDCPLLGPIHCEFGFEISREMTEAVEEYNKRSLELMRKQRDAAVAQAANIDSEKIREVLLKNPPLK